LPPAATAGADESGEGDPLVGEIDIVACAACCMTFGQVVGRAAAATKVDPGEVSGAATWDDGRTADATSPSPTAARPTTASVSRADAAI
jgi:hypothetical protein